MVSSAGCDGIAVEMIKHAPETIDKKIVNTFNNIAETADKSGRHALLLTRFTTNNLALSDTCSTSLKLMKFTSCVSYLMWHYRWNVEKKQVTPSRPTLWHHKGIVSVQINLHTISQKRSHHLHRTTRPRIHVTKNTHSPMYTPNTIIQS